jgi:hypothetical protein
LESSNLSCPFSFGYCVVWSSNYGGQEKFEDANGAIRSRNLKVASQTHPWKDGHQ